MSSLLVRRNLAALLLVTVSSTQCWAATELNYPELMVAPKASDRIKMEMENEGSYSWYAHWPIQAGAITAIVAGSLAATDSTNTINLVAPFYPVQLGVGGALIASTVLLSAFYRPYASAHKKLGAMEVKNKGDELVRERMAEEALRKAHVTGMQIRAFSSVALLATGMLGFLMYNGSGPGKTMGLVTAGTAILPMVFSYKWNRVYRQQMQYKKRIYGPIAYSGFTLDRKGDQVSLAPTVNFQLHF